jgi:hypothetical protein
MEPEANWRVHLLDPKGNFEKIYNFELLKKLGNGLFSESKRGVAGNTGGSTTIFLNDSDTLSALFPNIEAKYIGNGFKNNRVHRNYSMTLEDLSAEKGVLFPAPYENCIDGSIKLEEGFRSYFEAAENKYGKAKWKKIVNETYRSKAKAQIIIPRAEREKHAIYFSKDAREAVVSTNFFCYSGLEVEGVEIEISLKMISAYLLSAFGQIQFEMFGNNQEGLLKIEKFAIDKLKSIDPAMLGEEDMIMIGIAFDEFSTLGVTVKGDEGVRSPRKILDLAIAKVLLKYSTTNSSTPEELADFAELFLEELVIDRSS